MTMSDGSDAFTPFFQPFPGMASSPARVGCGSSTDTFLAHRARYTEMHFHSRRGCARLYLFSTRLA